MTQQMTHFLSFVEIRTKLATVLPFLTALAYVFYTRGTINGRATLIYLVSALLMDMSITAINNHVGHREENKIPHYTQGVGLSIIAIMMAGSAVLGLYLAVTYGGLTILLVGLLCVIVGFMYSAGPLPISKTLYGEAIAGTFVTTVVMFVVIWVNDPGFRPLAVFFDGDNWVLQGMVDVIATLRFLILTLPLAFCAANILLANNICDVEEDRPHRYTIVHNLGIEKSLWLFACLYHWAYSFVVLAVVLNIVPVWALLALLTYLPVQKGTAIFLANQDKETTFPLSVKHFGMLTVMYTVGIGIGAVVNLF